MEKNGISGKVFTEERNEKKKKTKQNKTKTAKIKYFG